MNALSFTIYAIAEHTEVDRRLREEIKSVLGDRPLTAQLLSELRYMEVRCSFCPFPHVSNLLLQCVLKESLRCYPVVANTVRSSELPHTFGPHTVPPVRRLLLLVLANA